MNEPAPSSLKQAKIQRLLEARREFKKADSAPLSDEINPFVEASIARLIWDEIKELEVEISELEAVERDHEIQKKLIDLEIAKTQAEVARASSASLGDLIRGVDTNGSDKD